MPPGRGNKVATCNVFGNAAAAREQGFLFFKLANAIEHAKIFYNASDKVFHSICVDMHVYLRMRT